MIKKIAISLILISLPIKAMATQVFLTSGSSWTVPSDWNSSVSTIEVIGAGGGGSSGNTSNSGGGGGGGGAYSRIINLPLTIGASVQYQVGTGGAIGSGNGGVNGSTGTDTWFNGSTLALSTVGAKGGFGGVLGSSITGGLASLGFGTTKFSGGFGTRGSTNAFQAGGGGGGAGGSFGAGQDGGIVPPGQAGGAGGGGAGGGTAGGSPSGVTNGGTGGNGHGGSGGGAGGAVNVGGSTGTATTGGGGGGGGNNASGAAGGTGNEFDSSHGSGGGGSGAGGGPAFIGGGGGLYGGGGAGGSGASSGNSGNGGAGANGVIAITYTPLNQALTAGVASLTGRGTTSASFSATDASGGTVTYTYQWKRRVAAAGSYGNVTGATTKTLSDTGLTPGTSYFYKLTYTDSGGGSVDSNEVGVRTWDSVSNTSIFFSPYNWYSDGTGSLQSNNVNAGSSATVSANTGAYFKTKVTFTVATSSIVLQLDTTSLQTLTASKCPTIYYRVYTSNLTPALWSTQLLAYSASTTSVTLGSGLSAGTYFVDVVFKSVDLTLDGSNVRWSTPGPRLSIKIVGLDTSETGTLSAPTLRSKNMIIFGDSITEAAASESNSTANAGNDTTHGMAWIVAQAFDAEFGIVGYGGSGYIQGINNVAASSSTPCLFNSTDANQFYNKYFGSNSRLVAGSFSPTPDFILVHDGFNDAGSLAASDVTNALNALRTAAGNNTWIFATSSNQGTNGNASKIQTGVANVTLTTRTKYVAPTQMFTPGTASLYSNDAVSSGAHSNQLGHAIMAGEIIKQAQSSMGTSGTKGYTFVK